MSIIDRFILTFYKNIELSRIEFDSKISSYLIVILKVWSIAMAFNPSAKNRTSPVIQVVAASQMQEAKRLHAAGRLSEAQAICEEVLAGEPGNNDARYLIGLGKLQSGRFDDAIRLLRLVLNANRANEVVRLNLADALKGAGHIDEAAAAYRKALKLNPKFVQAAINFSGLLCDSGRFSDALAHCDRALALDPHSIEALNNRGNALRGLGRPEAAIVSYDQALSLRPKSDTAHYNRGLALVDLGRLDEALASFDTALALEPGYARAHNMRGTVLRALRRPAEALGSYAEALRIDPQAFGGLSNMGIAFKDLGRYAEALRCFDQVLEHNPAADYAQNNRGDLLKELGRIEEARAAFEAAIERAPDRADYYFNLSLVKKFDAGDPMVVNLEALVVKARNSNSGDCAKFAYALGKAYTDMGQHDRAFRSFLIGAEAKRSTIDYPEADQLGLFDRVKAVFSLEFVAQKSGGGDPSRRPIFILGMPRSGTTLVEQILASHPNVFGAGELAAMNSAVNQIIGAVSGHAGQTFPEVLQHLAPADFARIGINYLNRIAELTDSHAHVTDKLPTNFFLAGLIHLAFPNARIIHTQRNPLDTCVSCFTILFTEENNHTYHLGEIGRYYRAYHDLMAHWRRVLPAGTFIDVQYEDVVADLEGQTRRLLDYCGLPWNDSCLSFHTVDRPVRTASLAQVRQPVYARSVGRWHHYAQYLGPLLLELGVEEARKRDYT